MDTETILFTDLGLSDELLKALDSVGYKSPTPIQAKAVPIVLMGRDVIGIAQTGTGKTASFTLPLLEILKGGRAKSRMPRALILAPTRELAAQIQDNIKLYSKFLPISTTLLVGGESMNEQTAQIQRGVDILIATPGRLLDHFQRGGIILTDTKYFVIDEADRMLDMGFIPDIEKIASFLPPLRQTLMFTATMPPEVRKLADKFLSNPKEISVARASSTAQTITQFVHHTTTKNKSADLLGMLESMKPSSALVFCNRKTDVDKVKRFLLNQGHKVEALHGDMLQSHRYASLDRFKSGESNVIICSDIAARGIDIDDVTHVFNLDIPRHAEDYVHRIGRTGRAGKSGCAITFVTEEDTKNLDAVEKLIQQKIPPLEGVSKKSAAPAPSAPAPSAPASSAPVREKKEAPRAKSSARPERKKPVDKDDMLDDGKKTVGFGDDLPAFMMNGL